jgi:hypothetical protein
MSTDVAARAEIQDYDELLAALRLRYRELVQIQKRSLDDFHMGKEPRLLVIGPILQALGIKLLIVEDVASMEQYRHRYGLRDEKAVRMLPIPSIIAPHLFTREKALACNDIRSQKVSPSVRSRIARRRQKHAGGKLVRNEAKMHIVRRSRDGTRRRPACLWDRDV